MNELHLLVHSLKAHLHELDTTSFFEEERAEKPQTRKPQTKTACLLYMKSYPPATIELLTKIKEALTSRGVAVEMMTFNQVKASDHTHLFIGEERLLSQLPFKNAATLVIADIAQLTNKEAKKALWKTLQSTFNIS